MRSSTRGAALEEQHLRSSGAGPFACDASHAEACAARATRLCGGRRPGRGGLRRLALAWHSPVLALASLGTCAGCAGCSLTACEARVHAARRCARCCASTRRRRVRLRACCGRNGGRRPRPGTSARGRRTQELVPRGCKTSKNTKPSRRVASACKTLEMQFTHYCVALAQYRRVPGASRSPRD